MQHSIHAVFLFVTMWAWCLPSTGIAHAQDVPAICAKAGNDDRLRVIPAMLIPRVHHLFGFSADAPAALVQKSTSYRCMSGKVWLSNYGANLVCGKANATRRSPGASEFCKANPGSDVVPMAATGHDTIFEWKCAGKVAKISKQIETVDPRGFLTRNWKQLEH